MSFRIAEKQALKSVHAKHKVGAVIVRGSRIISTGFNELRPSALIHRPTLHAEASAILKLLKESRLHDLSGSDIYVTRFTKGGHTGLSKPCKGCMELIRSVGIKRVYFTTDNSTEMIEA